MSVFTTARLADPLGNHLIEIATYTKLEYVLNGTPGAVGVCELTLPTSFDTSLLMRDGRLGVWRSINGAPPYLDNNAIFLIRTLVYSADSIFVRAYHATSLLGRRIVAYFATSSYTDKGPGPADDLIKEYWDENAGTLSEITARDGFPNNTDISAYVSRQADLSLGATVSKDAARRNLLEVAKELAEASATNGTYLTFEIVAPTENTLELRTYATARGVDRTAGTANPVVLSEARRNLEQAVLTIDDHDAATFAVVGGVGEALNRMVSARPDSTGLAILETGPFARIERFVDSSNTDSLPALEQEGDAELYNARSQTILTGRLVETPATMRGIHFDLGDLVTAEHPRSQIQFDARLDIIHETIDGNGRSTEIVLRSIA